MGTKSRESAVTTRQGLHGIFLVSVFSFVYVCLVMWDNGVIQQYLLSKKMVKYATRYSVSRAMSDSSNLVSLFYGNTSEDSTVSSTDLHDLSEGPLVNRTASIAATEADGKVHLKSNDLEQFTNPSILKAGTSKEISNVHKTSVDCTVPSSKMVISSTANKRVQIIIVTTKRSGSSFVGELFNSNRNIFYMYEPLFQVTFDVLKHRITNEQVESLAFSLWNHTLHCNYSSLSQHQTWLRRGGINTCKLSGAINTSKLLCPVKKIPNEEVGPIISGLCSNRPYTVLKTIRVMDIKDLRTFVEDPCLNIKILHLVRDPRAVMNSRHKLKEPNYDLLRRKGSHADEIKDLCDHMARNLQYKDDPPIWLKGKYMLVRFEDVAKDPIEQTKRIYRQLGIEMHQDVITWLNNNTHGNKDQKAGSPFSRTRETEKIINAWKTTILEQMKKEIERKCSYVMDTLSYND